MIHDKAEVYSNKIGKGTQVWQFAVVLHDAVIGDNCNINCHTFIENNVIIGNNVTIKSGVYIWDGIIIEDDVFVGPNVTFTNDIYPRSKKRIDFVGTTIGRGASIGANSTLLAGVKIGMYSMIGIGSVITKDIPDYALFFGNPAKQHGWVDEKGNKLHLLKEKLWTNNEDVLFSEVENGLKKLQ